MFHEITESQVGKRKRARIAIACCIVALAVAACLAYGSLRADARTQGAASLRGAILQSAKQCCAIEGSYPASIEYLEQRYGLIVDRAEYTVSYECFAGNVMPSVVVTPK